mgnify:CR=1 FL=1
MKQLIQSYKSGEMEIAEIPVPACREEGMVVQTHFSLISAGTEKIMIDLAKKSLLGKAKARPDLVRQVINKVKQEGLWSTWEKVKSRLDNPVPLGYSCAGNVVEVGEKIKGFSPGDRVACAGAGYANHAEYNFIPRNLCVKVADSVHLEQASFTTVGAIAMQGVRQAEVSIGENVTVLGLGLVGLLTVQILKAAGCRVLGFDPDPFKVKLSQELGCDVSVSSNIHDACKEFTNGRGSDSVIITASTKSSEPIRTAGEISRQKGIVVVVGLVGMEVPRDIYYKKELDLRLSMSYGPGRYDRDYEEKGIDYPFGYVRWTEKRNMASFLDLIQEKRVNVKKLITHRSQFKNAIQTYKILESDEKYVGIVLGYDTEKSDAYNKTIELKQRNKPNEDVSVGWIGVGNFARGILLPAFSKNSGYEFKTVCDADGMAARKIAEQYSFEKACSDFKDVLDDDSINTLVVTVPHNLHGRYVLSSLKAGKNVHVEKPLSIYREELYEIDSYMRERSGDIPVLHVGYNRRFSGILNEFRGHFSDELHPLVVNYRVNAGVVPLSSWIQDPEIGGGRIVGEVCHFIELCTYLVKGNPTDIYACSIRADKNNIVDEDSVNITIGYDNGCLAAISYASLGDKMHPKERIEIIGGGKLGVLDNFKSGFITSNGKKRKIKRFNMDKGYVQEIKAFLTAIKEGEDPPISWEQLYSTSNAAFAVLESLRKREKIEL